MKLDILAIGEPMIELNQTGEGGGRLFLQGYGGDTSNALVAAARYASAAAALATTGYGAVAPLPRPAAVEQMLARG